MTAPRPPYDATASRPSWTELPADVRTTVVRWFGEPTEVGIAGGGFTGGFAASLRGASGERVFVKAVSSGNPPIADSYRREIAVHGVLPVSVPAPRLLRSTEVPTTDGSWVVLAFEQVEGRMPGGPWTDRDLATTIVGLEQMARGLASLDQVAHAGVLGEARLSVDASADAEQTLWTSLDAQRLSADLRDWADENRARLAEATAAAPSAFTADSWIHGDVRADNLIVGAGRLWVVDWNWLTRAPAWVDLGLMLPHLHADGVALGPVWASPLFSGVPADDVDAGLAWLAALMLTSTASPVPPGASPWLRPHQRWYGEAAVRLLRARWDG